MFYTEEVKNAIGRAAKNALILQKQYLSWCQKIGKHIYIVKNLYYSSVAVISMLQPFSMKSRATSAGGRKVQNLSFPKSVRYAKTLLFACLADLTEISNKLCTLGDRQQLNAVISLLYRQLTKLEFLISTYNWG